MITQNAAPTFAWVNGPYQLMGRIVAKTILERASCVLLAPDCPKPWLATLVAKLLVVARFRLHASGPNKEGRRFVPNPRVPHAPRRYHTKWLVIAYLIRWP